MVKIIRSNYLDRQDAKLANYEPADGTWEEIVILPFSSKMTQPDFGGYLQWAPDECIKISGWFYYVLGFLWPLLFLIYTKKLIGQETSYPVSHGYIIHREEGKFE